MSATFPSRNVNAVAVSSGQYLSPDLSRMCLHHILATVAIPLTRLVPAPLDVRMQDRLGRCRNRLLSKRRIHASPAPRSARPWLPPIDANSGERPSDRSRRAEGPEPPPTWGRSGPGREELRRMRGARADLQRTALPQPRGGELVARSAVSASAEGLHALFEYGSARFGEQPARDAELRTAR